MNPLQLRVNRDRVVVDAHRVCVPVMDRDPQFGDGVHGRVPACGGRRFLVTRHPARVKRGVVKIGRPDLGTSERRRQAMLLAREPDMSNTLAETSAADAKEVRPSRPARELMPVTGCDNGKVNDVAPRLMWRRLNSAFQDGKRRLREIGDRGACT